MSRLTTFSQWEEGKKNQVNIFDRQVLESKILAIPSFFFFFVNPLENQAIFFLQRLNFHTVLGHTSLAHNIGILMISFPLCSRCLPRIKIAKQKPSLHSFDRAAWNPRGLKVRQR